MPGADDKNKESGMSVVEIKVPDIGDFDAVEVIEVLIKAGDTVAPEQSLIVLESDKASMEVPSEVAGKIVDVKVKVGDKVSKGTVIATAEAGAAAAPGPAQAPAPAPAPAAAPAASAPAPQAAKHAGGADIECEMLVLGSGPGGYSAAFRSADLGMNTVLVERFDYHGTHTNLTIKKFFCRPVKTAQCLLFVTFPA